uniref:UTP25 C-terminal domain-containing protein n=1 Tax=Theileria annulata TaxID=5874 RepID=A0A3B0N8H9_THEAN
MKFARQQFQSKNIPILITTIRLLFFKRYLFKGTSKIFLLEPPEYVQIYKDLIRMLDENRNNTIICYYTNYHAIVLEPIVGSNNISKLINAPNTKIIQFN